MLNEPFDLPDNRPSPPSIPLDRVVGINFGIMLLYMLLTGLLATPNKISSYGQGDDALLIAAHTAVNLAGGLLLLFTRHRRLAQGLLLSALLVPIVGFGLCIMKDDVFS